MYKIGIVGAGQLGSRHLQALALLKKSAEIYVIDPVEEARIIAKSRFEEIQGHKQHQISFFPELSRLNEKELDLVVVATNSSVRHNLTVELLRNFEVKYMVLEKFLFQREKYFEDVRQLLRENGTQCFVNCPRRMFMKYKDIKMLVTGSTELHMDVVGNNWGLGCNGVHFIDLFQYLCGDLDVRWDDQLDAGYKNSKRPGYVEFTGRLSGKSAGGNTLCITSFRTGKTNISVRISTPSHKIVVAEGLGKVSHEIVKDNEINFNDFGFSMQYQSQLTNIVAEQLFEEGNCDLTPYEESVSAHLPLFRVLLNHYNNSREEKSEVCPIT